MTSKKIPERMCVGCGEMKPKRALLRVVKSAEGGISLDTAGKAPGRGAYLCPNPACLSLARKKRRLERCFSSMIPPEVYDALEASLAEMEKST